MIKKVRFLCLRCGKTTIVPIRNAVVLKGVVRCYFPPKGWALLYPPKDFPARSGICTECVLKALQKATVK